MGCFAFGATKVGNHTDNPNSWPSLDKYFLKAVASAPDLVFGCLEFGLDVR